jgi:glycosyltransferase involved in cell wall biosynthesis
MQFVMQDPTHGVIIPSYNAGLLLVETLNAVLKVWRPVTVVLDGCTDGSDERLAGILAENEGVHVITMPRNEGKGAAVFAALSYGRRQGWSHALVFDSDGQHSVEDIPRFMQASKRYPEAMILGVPVFGEDAPAVRVWGRCLGNWWANLETLWGGIRDSLFGFRVYPVNKSLEILSQIRGGRRFDFDTQLAVRLYWDGVQPVNLYTKVVYRSRMRGGVSHFHYFHDNLLLFLVHANLAWEALFLVPHLWRLRQRPPLDFQ